MAKLHFQPLGTSSYSRPGAGGKLHFQPLPGSSFTGASEIEGLELIAQEAGMKPPKPRTEGVLSRLMGLLTAGETAPLVYKAMETGDIGQGIQEYGKGAFRGATLQGLKPERKSYSDVLKLMGMPEGKIAGPVGVRNALGLLMDIGLDPTTYVGAGLIKKVAAPAVKKVLSPVAKTKTAGKAADFIGKLFTPGYDVKKLGKEGEEFLSIVNKLRKGTRAGVKETTEKVAKLAEKATLEYGPEAGKTISEVVETGQKTGLKGIDEIADMIVKRSSKIAEAEKSARLLKSQIENYLRHYITPEAREFLQKYGPDSLTPTIRKFKVSLGAAKKRSLSGTIEQINEEFMKKQGINLFEPDAFKAWAGREVEHIKAIRMDSFLKEVEKKFGLKGKTTQIIDGVRYVPYQPKGALRFFPMEKGVGVTKKVKTFLLPEPIAQHLTETIKTFSSDEGVNAFLKVYDKALGFWKGSVTGWFPAFHGRNFMGGTFNNFIAGVKNPIRYLQAHNIASGKAGEIITKAGKKISYDDIRRMVSELGVSGQPGYLDVFKTIEEAIGEVGETGLKKGWRRVTGVPRVTMEFVEDRLRIPLFIDDLIKGLSPDEAAKRVMQFHFDYAPEAFTSFERNVMKRLIPFYTWSRNNIPLQLTQMAKQPGKYSAVIKGMRSLRGEMTGEDISALPQYMREQFPIEFGEGKEGTRQVAYGLSLPIEEIGEVFGETPTRTLEKIAGKTAPPAKLFIEYLGRRNLFLGKPMEEVNYVAPILAKIPGMQSILGIREETNKQGEPYYVSSRPELLHLLTTALGRLYTTSKKLTTNDMSLTAKVLYSLLGVKVRGVDIEQELSYRERERAKEIEKFLEKEGVLRKFERYYKPKEK